MPIVTMPSAAPNELGFRSFYVHSLAMVNGSQMHSTGAPIGIQPRGDRWVFALPGATFQGSLFVCTRATELPAALPYRAEAVVSLSGPLRDVSELRIWADINGQRQVSLLPECADVAMQSNGALGLTCTGEDMRDARCWHTLSSALGFPAADEPVSVCVGLQSAAGADPGSTAVLVEALRLVSDERPRERERACPPSLGLVSAAQLAALVTDATAAAGVRAGSPPSGTAAASAPSAAAPRTAAGLGAMATTLIVIGVIFAVGFFGTLGWMLLRPEPPPVAGSSTTRTSRCTAIASVRSHAVEVMELGPGRHSFDGTAQSRHKRGETLDDEAQAV